MPPATDAGRTEGGIGGFQSTAATIAASVAGALVLLVLAAPARGQTPAGTGPAAAAPAPAVTPPAPAPPAPTEAPAATAPPPPAVPAEPTPPVAAKAGPVPTADATPSPSDHDAVVGHVGLDARRFDPGPMPLALRPAFGCPAVQTTPCQVALGALDVRYWTSRNFAWNGGVVFGAGGGRDGGQTLDTYLGIGPVVGMSLLVGNWRHFAIAASPELALVWFRPGPSATIGSTTMLSLRAALEGELHFGFVGVPALSVGLVTGMGLAYESGPSARVWSVGVLGAESVWGMLTNLFVRYYL